MAITGQISLARSGENVQIFQEVSDINDIFDPNSTPILEKEDHVTLYPGDFSEIDPIEIPEDVYVTVLPGARLNYAFDLGELEKGGRITERYEDFSGSVENVADLHIANQYETSTERTFSRIRLYVRDRDDARRPFVEYNNIDKVAQEAEAGETILVFPGEYIATKNLMANNVTWNFLAGAIVKFNPDWNEDFEDNNPTPFGLFDDSVDVNGVPNANSKRTKVFGNGEFVLGSETATPVTKEESDDPLIDIGEWKNWHKYSLIALSENGSELNFEAKKIRARDRIDSIIKYSDSDKLNVDVENVVYKGSHSSGENVLGPNGPTFDSGNLDNSGEVPLPAFFLANGSEQQSDRGNINVNVGNVKAELKNQDAKVEAQFPHLAVGVNPNNETAFDDNVHLSFGDYNGPTLQEAVFFTRNTSPNRIVIQESDLKNSVAFAGNLNNVGNTGISSGLPKTHVILKDTEVQTDDEAPIVVGGSAQGAELSLSGTWLLAGNQGPFTLEDKTQNDSSDFVVKVYEHSFANFPLQNYEKILHDELNNIAWSEDVDSIR